MSSQKKLPFVSRKPVVPIKSASPLSTSWKLAGWRFGWYKLWGTKPLTAGGWGWLLFAKSKHSGEFASWVLHKRIPLLVPWPASEGLNEERIRTWLTVTDTRGRERKLPLERLEHVGCHVFASRDSNCYTDCLHLIERARWRRRLKTRGASFNGRRSVMKFKCVFSSSPKRASSTCDIQLMVSQL